MTKQYALTVLLLLCLMVASATASAQSNFEIGAGYGYVSGNGGMSGFNAAVLHRAVESLLQNSEEWKGNIGGQILRDAVTLELNLQLLPLSQASAEVSHCSSRTQLFYRCN